MNRNEEEFNAWVYKIYTTHNDIPTHCTPNNVKQIEVTCNAQEQQEIESRLNCFAGIIDTERVDLLQLRCKGVWLQEENLVEIIEQVGTIVLSLGTQNALGKFISSFEALFLLETNRLEIIEDNIPWTMKKAYQTLLRSSGDITKYKCYRKHALDGSLNEESLLQSASSTTTDDDDNERRQCRKKMRVDHSDNLDLYEGEGSRQSSCYVTKTFIDIFNELQANGPQGMTQIFDADKKLRIIEMKKELVEKLSQGKEFCCYTNGESSLVRAHIVNIPTLSTIRRK